MSLFHKLHKYAPKNKRYHGIHPIRHNKDRYRRVKNKVQTDTNHYKELGRRNAKWRAHPEQQRFYDDKDVTQYAIHHMSPTQKIVTVVVIFVVLSCMVVGAFH